jgi:lipopolysaccharide transport system permease protein
MNISHATTATPPIIRLEPTKGWIKLGLRGLVSHRELLYFLIWRDVKVRYKQTALGALWAVIQPLMTMLIFSLFFGRLARMPSDGIPYPIFSFAALVPWTFFANAISQSSNSLVGSANLITKVYFPRMLMPIASVLAGLIDFALSFVFVIGMVVFYGIRPNVHILFLPLFLLLAILNALGVGLWLSALNVNFRDVRHSVPFIVQFWMFATPIAYPSSLLHEPWHTLYGLNPMAGVVEGFRWSLLGTHTAPGLIIVFSTAVALLLVGTGLIYFRRMERTFADYV